MRISDWSSDVCSSDLPTYRQAKRSLAQFDLELARLGRQCAKRSVPQAASGDLLVDSYFYHYLLCRTMQPADKAELRHQARLMEIGRASCRERVCQYV